MAQEVINRLYVEKTEKENMKYSKQSKTMISELAP